MQKNIYKLDKEKNTNPLMSHEILFNCKKFYVPLTLVLILFFSFL